jgi:hypothetical protein
MINSGSKFQLMAYYHSIAKEAKELFLPISSATLARARRNASQQPSTAELLLNVRVKGTFLLMLLKFPLDMVALLCFLSSSLTLLSLGIYIRP